MKKKWICLIAILGILFSIIQVEACTSFAVYGEQVWYGMNFDFPDTDLRFVIETEGDIKTFSMAFKVGDEYVPTVRMNSHGLFLAEQMQYPDLEKIKTLTGNQFYIGDVGPEVHRMASTADMLSFIADKRLVNRNVTVHHLIADIEGDAVVVEAGEDENRLVKIQENYLVMTNFTQSDFIGPPKDAVSGAGADRYQSACSVIEGNTQNFTEIMGWKALKAARQTEGDWKTQCAMLFDPMNQVIMIALKDDAERVWKLDLDSGTIENRDSKSGSVSYSVDSKGILASELRMGHLPVSEARPLPEATVSQHENRWGNALGIIGALGILVIVIGRRPRSK